MNKKVSLVEIVGMKIIFAVIFALVYWMWARSDYQAWYPKVTSSIVFFAVGLSVLHYLRIKKYKREGIDELAEKILDRCDAICLKVLVICVCVISFLGGIMAHVNTDVAYYMGWGIIISIIVVSILRTLLFYIMDKKGL